MKVFVTGGSGFIGTALVHALLENGHDVISFDLKAPQDAPDDPRFSWINGDLLDSEVVERSLSATQPDAIFHLAARTDTDSDDVGDYRVNTVGTQILADAAVRVPSVVRFVHVSTQFVARSGVDVSDPLTFDPHTAYGESKVSSELMIRELLGSKVWTIVRPTNIWGAWHPRYPYEFWRVLDRGLYFHPSKSNVRRTYGYVGNIAHQMLGILKSPTDAISGEVFYLGDPPLLLEDWADAFSVEITGKRIRKVPYLSLKALATFGDVLKSLGVRFPLTSSRLASMTEDYVVPVDKTLQLFGAPISLDAGVKETVVWLRRQGLVKTR